MTARDLAETKAHHARLHTAARRETRDFERVRASVLGSKVAG